MYFLKANRGGSIWLTTGDWLTLHWSLTVFGSPVFVRVVPRAAMLRMVRDYHRGLWGRVTADDKARHAGRAGYLVACYNYGAERVHVVTDHERTWFMLAGE